MYIYIFFLSENITHIYCLITNNGHLLTEAINYGHFYYFLQIGYREKKKKRQDMFTFSGQVPINNKLFRNSGKTRRLGGHFVEK